MIRKSDLTLSDALIEKALIDKNTVEGLIKESEASGQTLQQVLIRHKLFTEIDILNVLAQKLKVPT